MYTHHLTNNDVDSAPSKRQQRLGQDKLARLAHKFSTSADGRIMIEDGADKEDTAVLPGAIRGHDDDDDNDDNNKIQGEDYYLESKQSRETYTRVGQRIKFNNRGTHVETFDNDSDADDNSNKNNHTATTAGRNRASKPDARRTTSGGNKSAKPLIGQAYRSKKVGGDVKRAGRPDPYAYIPLNPLTLKKR
jgi:ribosomal RNA-processing protein 12